MSHQVDIPEQKSRFLEMYYTRYRRPFREKLLAFGEKTHHQLVSLPFLYNGVIAIPGVKQFFDKVLGLTDLPQLSSPSYLKRAQKTEVVVLKDYNKLPSNLPDNAVIVLPDAMTAFYEAEVLDGVTQFLKSVGLSPVIAPFLVNGKGQHVKGFLKEFRQTVQEAQDKLEKLGSLSKPILTVDPAIALTYREEYKNYGRTDLPKVWMPQEWLSENLDSWQGRSTAPDKAFLMGHCGEKTALPSYMKQWQSVFKKFSIDLEEQKVGCCGMAGAFGHESKHYDESRGIFAQSWEPKIRNLIQRLWPQELPVVRRLKGLTIRGYPILWSGYHHK